jgi:hypothetical protein
LRAHCGARCIVVDPLPKQWMPRRGLGLAGCTVEQQQHHCTTHHAPRTMHHAPCTMHHAPCIILNPLPKQWMPRRGMGLVGCTIELAVAPLSHAPRTTHHVPCTTHHVPCIIPNPPVLTWMPRNLNNPVSPRDNCLQSTL